MNTQPLKILIFGAGKSGPGWLAGHYLSYFNAKPDKYLAEISTADITQKEQVTAALEQARPGIVINAAGKTHSAKCANIDGCEESEEAKQQTLDINAKGPKVIAECCAKKGIRMVHLSSGCIFDGYKEGGFTENDTPNPVSWYTQTKVMADENLRQFPNVLILRIRMPISDEPVGRNFIYKVAHYKKVINVINSVTVVDSLMQATEELIAKNQQGIFNVVNPVPVNHFKIMEWYDQIVDPSHKGTYEKISLEELSKITLTGRSNCTISTKKLNDVGVYLPDAPQAIQACLRRYVQVLKAG